MVNDFDLGFEQANAVAGDAFGKDSAATINGVSVTVIVNEWYHRSEVSETGGRRDIVRGNITVSVADYVNSGGRKGKLVVLSGGRTARIEFDPHIPADSRGVVDLSLVQT